MVAAGTSFASPLVAGVAALAENEAREDDDDGEDDMSPADHRLNLIRTADDLGDPGPDTIFSQGRLNAGRAVAEAEAGIADDDDDDDEDDD